MLKNDFIEINFKMLVEYEYINKSHIVITAFKLINDDKEDIHATTYHNKDDILYKNFVYLNKYIFIILKRIQKNYEY